MASVSKPVLVLPFFIWNLKDFVCVGLRDENGERDNQAAEICVDYSLLLAVQVTQLKQWKSWLRAVPS